MASLILPEALKRANTANNGVMSAVASAIVTTDQMANVLPLVPVNTVSVNYKREGLLPSTLWTPDSGVNTESSVGVDDSLTVQLRRMVGNIDLDYLAEKLTGSPGEQKAAQLVKKVKATWREAMTKFISGAYTNGHTLGAGASASTAAPASYIYGPGLDSQRMGPGSIKYTHSTTSWQFRAPGDIEYGTAVVVASGTPTVTLKSWNPSRWITVTITAATAVANAETLIWFTSSTNEYEGVKKFIEASQFADVVGGNGDAFSFAFLDNLITREKVNSNRAFFCNGGVLEQFYAANRALGGQTSQTIQLPGYGSPVPMYRGIPILQNDYIANETIGSGTCSDIYLASFDAADGLCMAVANTDGEAVTPDASPVSKSVLGFSFTEVGAIEGQDAARTRVRFVGAPMLKSVLAIARKRGVVSA